MSLAHKNLYVAVNRMLLQSNVDTQAEVAEALVASRASLSKTKSFEYTGEIEMNGGNIIKCVGIKTDLDDVVRAMNNGERNVKRTGSVSIVLDEKAMAEVVPEVTPVQYSEYGE